LSVTVSIREENIGRLQRQVFPRFLCQAPNCLIERLSVSIDRIEEAALFELIDQRQIDKLLGL
jgi:hypothetical protein